MILERSVTIGHPMGNSNFGSGSLPGTEQSSTHNDGEADIRLNYRRYTRLGSIPLAPRKERNA
jgi:hypothetical protein